MGRKPTKLTIEDIREQNKIRSKRYYHKHKAKKRCDCHLHEKQVCDICQDYSKNGTDVNEK